MNCRNFKTPLIGMFVSMLLVLSCQPILRAQILQTIKISSSPNPVGSGARALGMGGAFIGVADDATAASWNTGGLIQLERPEISIVGTYSHRTEDTFYAAFPEASGAQRVSAFDLNYFSFAYPFTLLNRNMIVSLNYQHLYDFDKKVKFFNTYSSSSGSSITSFRNDMDYRQEGALWTISPAFAVQITPEISVGITLNFWQDIFNDNGWKSAEHYTRVGMYLGYPFTATADLREEYKMEGFNFNLGVLWNINSIFSLGAVFKSPFSADLKHHYSYVSSTIYPTVPANDKHYETKFSEDETLDMPMSYGLGLSARMSDALTLDIDVYRTEWGDYVLHRPDGTEWNSITGNLQSESDISATTQVRMGGEYLIIGEKMVVPIRAGIFYDPEPSPGNPDDFWGISLGSGIAYKRIVYDIAYQYRFGRDVRTVTLGNQPSHQDVDQHKLYMSFIYHF